MPVLLLPFILLLILLHSGPAWALEEKTLTEDGLILEESDSTHSYVIPYVRDFVKTPKGGVSWDLFAQTKEISYQEKDPQGFDLIGVRPAFPKDLKNLHGSSIVMEGYMFPLEDSDKQHIFLFGPFPISCPYHYHVGPALVIEVHAAKPIAFTYDPIHLTGTLELIDRDDENNLFYRLKNAKTAD